MSPTLFVAILYVIMMTTKEKGWSLEIIKRLSSDRKRLSSNWCLRIIKRFTSEDLSEKWSLETIKHLLCVGEKLSEEDPQKRSPLLTELLRKWRKWCLMTIRNLLSERKLSLFISEKWSYDPDDPFRTIIRNILRSDPTLFEFFPEIFRKDNELQLIAVKHDPRMFRHCYYRFTPFYSASNVPEGVLEVLMKKRPGPDIGVNIGVKLFHRCKTLCDEEKSFYEKLFVQAIQSHGVSFFKSLWACYTSRKFDLENDNRPYISFCMDCDDTDPRDFFPFNNPIVMRAAIKKNWRMLTYTNTDLHEDHLLNETLSQSGYVLQYIYKSDLKSKIEYLKTIRSLLTPKIQKEKWFERLWGEAYSRLLANEKLFVEIKNC